MDLERELERADDMAERGFIFVVTAFNEEPLYAWKAQSAEQVVRDLRLAGVTNIETWTIKEWRDHLANWLVERENPAADWQPGDLVTWLHTPRGGYGYTFLVDGVVVSVGPKRVTIEVVRTSGEIVRRSVRPEHLRPHGG